VFLGEASWQKFSLVYSKLHVPADFDLSSHAVELAHEEEEEEEGGAGEEGEEEEEEEEEERKRKRRKSVGRKRDLLAGGKGAVDGVGGEDGCGNEREGVRGQVTH